MQLPDFHAPAIVCPHVLRRERPVLLVSHAGGDWQFLCGHSDHDGDGAVVGIGHLVEHDPALCEVLDLPADWEAERGAPDAAWQRTVCPPEQD